MQNVYDMIIIGGAQVSKTVISDRKSLQMSSDSQPESPSRMKK